MNKKIKAVLLSSIFWGTGQLLVFHQKLKGTILLLMQIAFISLEIRSGYWIEYFQGLIPDFSIRLHGGFFTRGIWGIITLGDEVGGMYGDHSTILIINGIIAISLLFIFIFVYIWNLKDVLNQANNMDMINVRHSFNWEKELPYIILIPIGIAFFFIVVMPIIFTFLTAFLNYNRNHLPPGQLLDWVGISNFKKLFTVSIWSKTFSKVLVWTVIWTLASTLGTYFLGLFQALILNHKCVKFKGLFRTILILPWAIPQMVSLLVFRNLFNGQFSPINQFLLKHEFISQNIPFLSDPLCAKVTVILVSIWLGFPMFMIMLSGVLSNMDGSLYEAASLDGANGRQQFSYITLPLVFRATMPNLIMTMAANFNGFGLIYFLTQGGPTNSNMQFAGDTDILISWIYKLTLDQKMFDIAAVMSVLLFIIVGTVSLWNFKRTAAFKEI